MTLYYVAFSEIPSNRANSIQVMRMCEAFAGVIKDVRLYCRQGSRLVENLFEFYGIHSNFNVRAVRVPHIRFFNRIYYAFAVIADLRREPKPLTVYLRDQFLAGMLCRMSSRRYRAVLEVHAPPKNRYWRWWIRGAVRSKTLTHLVAISQALATEYQRLFPDLAAERILVAHDGACAVDGNRVATGNSLTSQFGPRVAVGYVGSLRPGKGAEIIQELASSLPQFDFHIVGGDEECVQSWRKKSKSTNLVFHGFVSPPLAQKYIESFDILLAPYKSQVLVGDDDLDIGRWMSPLKIFEYMSHGKAIVASDLPVLREVLSDGVNALLADPSDSSDWRNKVIRLVENAELRQQLGLAAQKDFQDKYTWERRAALIIARLGLLNRQAIGCAS